MPLLVRGGGGGKSTKDATAVPGDVKKGKIFYGRNGREVGIFDSPFPNIKQINISLKANVDYPISNPIDISKYGGVVYIGDYSINADDIITLNTRSKLWGYKFLDLNGSKLLGVKFGNYFVLNNGTQRGSLYYVEYDSDTYIVTYKSNNDPGSNQVSHKKFGFCFHNKALYIGFINGSYIYADKFMMFHKNLDFTIYYE